MTSAVEVWRAVTGYEGIYEVSSCGRVRSIDRTVELKQKPGSHHGNFVRFYPGREITRRLARNGYFRVRLAKEGEKQWYGIHRLVCEAFNGTAPTPSHVAAHWDGNKLNNTPANLRWATQKENVADRERHGTVMRGLRNPASKISDQQVLEIRKSELPRKQLAMKFGIAIGYVDQIRSNVARPILSV